MTYTPSPVEVERRKRIQLSVYAYAYEMLDVSLVDDHAFDALARSIRPGLCTGHKIMDKFFKTEFHADTGMWIHKHPQLEGIKRIYDEVYSCKRTNIPAKSPTKKRRGK
jgi:hypothetical protein